MVGIKEEIEVRLILKILNFRLYLSLFLYFVPCSTTSLMFLNNLGQIAGSSG
jgi:hypothetical protein